MSAASTALVDRILPLLDGVTKSGKGWSARCPAHADRKASLTVSVGNAGRILLKCHAGCETTNVVKKIGLTMADLFDKPNVHQTNGKRRLIASYDYRDERSKVLFRVRRYDPKGFDQCRPTRGGKWIASVSGVRKVPYKLPELVKAGTDEPVFIVEGEKDVESLFTIGVLATCNAMGAGKWTADHSNFLRGRRVIILPDNDEPGRKHAEQVARSLEGVASNVKVVLLPDLLDKGDVSDWLKAGGTKNALLRLVTKTKDWQPAATVEPESDAVLVKMSTIKAERVSWLWLDRIPLGKLTIVCGDPGLGKSLVTIDIAARVSSGRPFPGCETVSVPASEVVLLSAEDDPADTIRPRLDAAGANVKRIHLLKGVASQTPNCPATFNLENDLPSLVSALKQNPNVRLVVIDPVSAYLGKVNSHQNSDVRALLGPLADVAQRYRVAVVVVSHLNKGVGGKAMYRASGSLAFVAASRSAWLVTDDRDDSNRRLFLPLKNNLARTQGTGLAYHIKEKKAVPVVVWSNKPVEKSADDALSESEGPRSKRPIDQAIEFLRGRLANGQQPASTVEKEADEQGISPATLRRATKLLCLQRRKKGFGKQATWIWQLPTKGTQRSGGSKE